MGVIGFCIFLFIGVIIIPIVLAVKKGIKEGNNNNDIQKHAEIKLQERGFKIEKRVGGASKLYLDNTNQQWAIHEWGSNDDVTIYKYSDLIDFELLEDKDSVIKGGMGKALIGGAIAGTTGAIIGSANSKKVKQTVTLMEVKVRTNDFNHAQYTINFIDSMVPFRKDSAPYKEFYKLAQETIGVLHYISTNGKENKLQETVSLNLKQGVGDSLRELNQLKIEGIISEDEFEKKKKELLNL